MRMRSVGLLLAAWCLSALLTTLQSVYYTTGSRLDAVAPALVREGLLWLVWVPVTPWIVRRAAAAGALRGLGRALVGNIALALALALGVGFGLLNGWFSHLVGAKDYEHVGYALAMGVIDWLPYQLLVFAGVFAAGLALEAARRRRRACSYCSASCCGRCCAATPRRRFRCAKSSRCSRRTSRSSGCGSAIARERSMLEPLLELLIPLPRLDDCR